MLTILNNPGDPFAGSASGAGPASPGPSSGGPAFPGPSAGGCASPLEPTNRSRGANGAAKPGEFATELLSLPIVAERDRRAWKPLPMSMAEARERGWHELDIVFVTGDAYIDHPSFAMAILGRTLEAAGFRVGLISQPDWHSCAPWREFGRPRLFFGISAGNMDSMINHYTANRKVRNDDAYSPGGRIGLRPDRATLPYCHRAREAYPGVPVIAGGVEASLRRLAHYDYWSDKVRKSILLDAKADLVVYGMGEDPIVEIARRLAAGETVRDLRNMRGVAYVMGAREAVPAVFGTSPRPKRDGAGASFDQAAFGSNSAALEGRGLESDPSRREDSPSPGSLREPPSPSRGKGQGRPLPIAERSPSPITGEVTELSRREPFPLEGEGRLGGEFTGTAFVHEDQSLGGLTPPARREAFPEQPWEQAARLLRHFGEPIILPSFELIAEDKYAFAEATRIIHHETNPWIARPLVQWHGNQAVVTTPPPLPIPEAAMDRIYDLPYTRLPHPIYREKIPAWEMIKDSVTIMRGCFGGCTFCSITAHQGRTIQSRSKDSVLAEVRTMTNDRGFKGIISDIGGPTANMYEMRCTKPEVEAICRRQSCVHPTVCKLLGTDHGPLIDLMKEARETPGIRKVLVASGIRMDLARRSPAYMKELAAHHVGGLLKVAPEHTDTDVLNLMRKPGSEDFTRFAKAFDAESKKAGKKQHLVPYYIASHPGSDLNAMIDLAVFLKRNGYKPDQVQDFIPAPFDVATAMYHTGLDPFTKKPVTIAKQLKERKLQRALLQWFKPENWFEVRQALIDTGRTDLIADGCSGLIPSRPPKEALKARRDRANRDLNHAADEDVPAGAETPNASGVSPRGTTPPPVSQHGKSPPAVSPHGRSKVGPRPGVGQGTPKPLERGGADDHDHYHSVANPARGEQPGERGAKKLQGGGYRPGRKTAARRPGKRPGRRPGG
jgi:uncharacterized radical SAM protein YgiQ